MELTFFEHILNYLEHGKLEYLVIAIFGTIIIILATALMKTLSKLDPTNNQTVKEDVIVKPSNTALQDLEVLLTALKDQADHMTHSSRNHNELLEKVYHLLIEMKSEIARETTLTNVVTDISVQKITNSQLLDSLSKMQRTLDQVTEEVSKISTHNVSNSKDISSLLELLHDVKKSLNQLILSRKSFD